MRFGKVLLIICVAMILAHPAGAAILGLNWGVGLHGNNVYWNGQHNNIYAGSFAATLDGSNLGSVFCADLEHVITIPSSYPVNIFSSNLLTNGPRAAWLYKTYTPTLGSDGDKAAGLQLAIWNAIYDTDNSVNNGSGTFYATLATSGAISFANTFLAASSGQTAEVGYYKSLPNDPRQDMIGPPVPEPATAALLLLGVGLSGIGLIRRRR